MMCKGGIAILNYCCVPSITNQSYRYVGLVTVCYKCLQQNESSVQFSRNETILRWIDFTEMSSVVLNYDERKNWDCYICLSCDIKGIMLDTIFFFSQGPPSISNPHKILFNLVYTYFICQLNGLDTS
jgi:hypothetical protein